MFRRQNLHVLLSVWITLHGSVHFSACRLFNSTADVYYCRPSCSASSFCVLSHKITFHFYFSRHCSYEQHTLQPHEINSSLHLEKISGIALCTVIFHNTHQSTRCLLNISAPPRACNVIRFCRRRWSCVEECFCTLEANVPTTGKYFIVLFISQWAWIFLKIEFVFLHI